MENRASACFAGYVNDTPILKAGSHCSAAVQQAHPADAALRPQDRAHFDIWFQPNSFPDLQGGAADGHGVGRLDV